MRADPTPRDRMDAAWQLAADWGFTGEPVGAAFVSLAYAWLHPGRKKQ